MRFAIAMPPRTIIRITAIGVSQAIIFVWRAVAPVRNGELCAPATREAPNVIATLTTRSAALPNPAQLGLLMFISLDI
jgi:hypothetical protein